MSTYEKCVNELRQQLHATNQARLAYERVCPDGTLTPRDDIAKDEALEYLRAFKEWNGVARKHSKAFFAMRDDLMVETGEYEDWPGEIGDLLGQTLDAMPRFAVDAVGDFLLAKSDGIPMNA